MSSSRPARIAILLGMLAVLAIPSAEALAGFLGTVSVLDATIVSVPAAVVLGLAGVSAARRARFRVERSVYRTGERTVRVARLLVWTGLYVGVIGGLALGFYGLLRAYS